MPTILERLSALAALDAVSGQEQPVVAHLKTALADVVDEVHVDAVGNLYAVRRGPRPGPTVLIAAHTDEIGLMVKAVEANGFLRFDVVGGVLDNLLAARLVRVRGHLGVIGMRAGHFQSAEERGRAPSAATAYVDVGARSAEAVAAMGIGVGDAIAFHGEVVAFGHDAPLVVGKAIDNRLGCAVAWALLEAGAPPAGTLVVAFTSQEEVGLKGARVAGERWRPDLAIALDTMPSGDTPDMSLTRDLNVRLGAGPVLQVLAGRAGTGFLVHPGVARFLRALAAAAGVPLQVTTFTGGNNDAAAMAWSGTGVPAASICLPRRYAHSPTEVADLRDADGALQLLRALVARMDDLPGFGFLDDA
jgi:putative aminopeptidase